ncbi:aspartate/glutamate racemase family protein [Granulosicoccus sp. 3-233]|uniref:aspartate/glutamate racemase family protein n=1 Tax=Granulosicoccus sp. 3-233 TaxID=3417969 RepID=UPI003D3353A5
MQLQSGESATDMPDQKNHGILVINPNGNTQVNVLIQSAARRVLEADTVVTVMNPLNSPLSIEGPEDRRDAEPRAIRLLQNNPGYDAYMMACFDDIAIDAGRSFLEVPVVACVEAALIAARFQARRFTIITTVETMVPGIKKLLERFGLHRQCTVRAIGVGVAASANGSSHISERINSSIRAARNEDGAKAIILGSAGLCGRARELSILHRLPVIDSIEAALIQTETYSRTRAFSAHPRHLSSSRMLSGT